MNFSRRSSQSELMDDLSVDDATLAETLDGLRVLARRLGGYSSVMSILGPILLSRANLPTRILDVGAGQGDFAEYLIQWASKRRLEVYITAIDINPATVTHARASLDGRLPHHLRDRIKTETADALNLPFKAESFDYAISSLMLHHLDEKDAVRTLMSMNSVSRHGVIVSDLHRSPIAYFGLKALNALYRMPAMVRNDGPISVLRGFTKRELAQIARAAKLQSPKIQWRWAFRWVLSSIR